MTEAVKAQAPDVHVDQRPWGRFEQLALNEACTVKIISVGPGQRLSLQRHEGRDELWQVLDGSLDVQVGIQVWTALTGERVWIPRGMMHRLGNSGDREGRVVEVAFGDFDEDDIERIEDDYSR